MAEPEESMFARWERRTEEIREQAERVTQRVQALVDNPPGAWRIVRERARQITDLGHDEAHDATHTSQELLRAAQAYIFAAQRVDHLADITWPWDKKTFSRNRIDNLIKAGALIAAEIDRLAALQETD